MKKTRLWKRVLAIALSAALVGSVMCVQAEELLPDSEAAEVRELNEEYDAMHKIGDKLDLQSAAKIDAPVARAVDYTSVYGYLEETGSISFLQLTLNPGVYLQAQLTQPANGNLDYNLYILNSEGIIQDFSEMQTYVNEIGITVPEAVGYITPGNETATYLIAVMSNNGGSATEPFRLDIAVSNVYDQYEPSENPYRTLRISYANIETYFDKASLTSPIDNDWYTFEVPENSKFDSMEVNIITDSANTCRYEIYRNISSSGYKMEYITSGVGKKMVDVLESGIYYIRVCNDKSVEDFNAEDLYNYILKLKPNLRVDDIEIMYRNGDEGQNAYVPYPPHRYFRTKNHLGVSGRAVAYDKATGEKYGVGGAHIILEYKNPYWRNNHTYEWASRSVDTLSDDDGYFNLGMDLPIAYGGETYRFELTTQYYDLNTFIVSAEGWDDATYSENFVQLKYSLYN